MRRNYALLITNKCKKGAERYGKFINSDSITDTIAVVFIPYGWGVEIKNGYCVSDFIIFIKFA